MNHQELKRICDSEHELRWKIVHENEKLFPTAIFFCCDICIDKFPYNKIRTRELIQK